MHFNRSIVLGHHSIPKINWRSFRDRREEKWGSFRGRYHFGVGIISGAVQIGDDALKVIKTFNYAEGNSSDWRVVMGKMEKHCIDEVNEIYEPYCFNMRDKLPTESVIVLLPS